MNTIHDGMLVHVALIDYAQKMVNEAAEIEREHPTGTLAHFAVVRRLEHASRARTLAEELRHCKAVQA